MRNGKSSGLQRGEVQPGIGRFEPMALTPGIGSNHIGKAGDFCAEALNLRAKKGDVARGPSVDVAANRPNAEGHRAEPPKLLWNP